MKEIVFEEKPIRILHWKQPFAGCMLHGKIETRTWDTPYRGLVIICASKAPYSENVVQQICRHTYWNFNAYKEQLIYGKAIAVGELVDSRPMQKKDEELAMVAYHDWLWCHVYENVRAIEPFEVEGRQKWQTPTQEIIDQIKFI